MSSSIFISPGIIKFRNRLYEFDVITNIFTNIKIYMHLLIFPQLFWFFILYICEFYTESYLIIKTLVNDFSSYL